MPDLHDMSFDEDAAGRDDLARTMGEAVQRTAAANLGRAFPPLVALAVTGLVQGLRGTLFAGEVFVLVGGSILVAIAMLAYGQLAVHKALGRPKRAWMVVASVGGLLPYAFGLYVVVGLGIMPLAGGFGLRRILATLFFVGAGGWSLLSQWRLTDLHVLVGADGNLEH